MAKGDTFPEFMRNVGQFPNLVVHRKNSVEGSKDFADKSLDMVFIDAGHMYHEVMEDIKCWLPKCKKLLCGHDYQWSGVADAVNEVFGRPDGVVGTIWWVDLTKRDDIDKLILKLLNNQNFTFVKLGDGEAGCMEHQEGANCDGVVYTPSLAVQLAESFDYFSEQKNTHIVYFGNQKSYNQLLHRTDSNLTKVKHFYDIIKNSPRKKFYVAPAKLAPVAKYLGCSHILCPEVIDEASAYFLGTGLVELIEKDCIVLFSAGLWAKVLIADCMRNEKNATHIDVGSAFDPAISQSRTMQVDKETMRWLYPGLV